MADTSGSGNLKGAAFMTGSMVAFVSSDAIMKSVSDTMTLWQALAIRGSFAAVFLILVVRFQDGFRSWPSPADRKILTIRTLADLGAALSFLTALFRVDLSIVASIAQVTPLAVTLVSGLLLGAEVGWRRYLAIVAGFLGVLLIIQPGGAGFRPAGLWVLVSVAFVVVRDLSTRRLSGDVSGSVAGMIAVVPVMVAGFCGALGNSWPTTFAADSATLALCAAVLIFGVVFAVESMRHGEVAVVAPFRYSAILWALMLDWAMFGKVPNGLALGGMFIVILTGLYTFHRERVRSRAPH